MSKADEFFKAMDEKSAMSADMQKAVLDKLYKGTVAKRLVTVEGEVPAGKRKSLNYRVVVLAGLLLVALTLLTGCASKHETLSSSPKQSISETTSTTSVEEVKQPADSTEPSTTTTPVVAEQSSKSDTSSPVKKTKTNNIEKKSTKRDATNSELSTSKQSDAELALNNPPAIGVTAPWYKPTIDTIAKAYTTTKPYEMGNNYALVNEGSYILYVFLSNSDTEAAYWSAVKIYNLEPSKIKVYPNVMLHVGKGNIITGKYEENDEWIAINVKQTLDTNNLPYYVKTQMWGPIKGIK